MNFSSMDDDDAVSAPGTTILDDGTISMDFDYIDELFFDGCWFETTAEGSDFPPFDSSFSWCALEEQHESQEAFFDDVKVDDVSSNQQYESEIQSFEGTSEGVTRWWIAPTPNNPGPGYSVMEKLMMALNCIQDLNRSKDMLIQIWVPVNRGGKQILTTNDLQFCLGTNSTNLAKYREISMRYQFSTEEEDSKGLVPGLPGRVFREKVPEWTPDVRFFRSDEYPRVDHAQEYEVRGTLALPIFEQGSRTCLGVIEVVMTSSQINYRSELESVCKALEGVDLRSSKLSSTQNVKACNKSYEAVLPEIKEVLRVACEMHKLPLAQTWIPCIQQGKEGCRHSEDNYLHCISPVEHACYVNDAPIRAFHDTCSEHHLLKGQGVAGGAFMTNQPCFSSDITSLRKTDYPLSHHARIFGLQGAVAIRLRSIYSSTDDYVLEFFLPVNCNDSEEQKKMLTSLSMIIQSVCHSLRVITDNELEEETNLSFGELIALADSRSARTEEKSSGTMVGKFSDLKQLQDLNENLDGVGECSTFGEGNLSSVGISKMGEKKRTKADKTITLQVLRQYFSGSLKDAAKNIGVCTTTLKRICRQHGIKRWPSRKIKKVGHSLQKLQLVIDSVQGASGAFQIDSFYSNFPDLASPNLSGTGLLSTLKQSDNPNSLSTTQPNLAGSLTPEDASKSRSSSCSQNSISSHPCSSMSEQQHQTINVVDDNKDLVVVGEDYTDVLLKRNRSEAELKRLSQQDNKAKLFPRSLSQETLVEQHPKTNSIMAPKKDDFHRVKVTYGDEKTRFRMLKTWAYEDLLHEICSRFNISDMSKYDVKYLDDDCEWILLTCDADLEECIDCCQSSECSTIKLSLQVSDLRMRSSLEFT
ncbi:hypothetical protein TanjilG_09718 [Lupinus angustifolius]|uniref:RWP-RK domain-containing protein n=1 Tax=Lupinus angustifolius TaxID=3871 RepID=A0A4P1QW57_LUPAN|nr:PREDICTED: protein NLP4-like isoform X1 [Lupinus angustifolius]XP_019417014.1 PREDICTED: protein NLP4-like isoform X1 [Lupinus angustifolius]OIV96291.1 hypothetical protein TanjilG_09718 [Lupinus angustifolius]